MQSVFRVTLALLLLGVAGCSGAREGLVEPQLTNPPRQDRWLNEGEPGEVAADTGPASRYQGIFRLPLNEDWSWELPDQGRWELARLELGTPAIAGDRLLVGSSRSPGLFVLDRATGQLRSVVATEGPVQAPPVPVAGGWLLVDSFGILQRLDEELEPVWKEAYKVGGAVHRSPVVSGDQVLVSTGSDAVVAVGLEDGLWRWTFKRDVPRGSQELAILGSPAPVLADGEILAGFSDGSLAGLDPSSGRELWSVSVGKDKFPDIQAEPLVTEDLYIVASFGGPIVGLDRRTRAIRWSQEEIGAVATMELAGGSVYTSDTRGSLSSLDAQTGEIEWTFEHKNAQFGSPLRVGGSVLVGDVGGTLYAIDRFEGSLQWRFGPSSGDRLAGVATRPAVDGRQVVFPSAGGRLYSLVAEPSVGTDDSEEPAKRPDRVIGW